MQQQRDKRIIVIFVTMFLLNAFPCNLLAQNKDSSFSRNAIYVEGLGPGIAYSINYEYRITEHIELRAGFSSWSMSMPFFSSNDKTTFTEFPLMVNYLIGGQRDHLELGLGMIIGNITSKGTYSFWGGDYSLKDRFNIGTAAIGFRMEPNDGGFMFRVTFTPLFTFKHILPFGGLSLGYAF